MEIEADEEGVQVIQKLCDIALRSGGLQNMNAVEEIMAAVAPKNGKKPKKKSE